MTTWTIYEPLNRSGYRDNVMAEDVGSPDWQCCLVTYDMPGAMTARYLFLQLPRQGIDRATAEKIVAKVLNGLNGTD